MTVVAATTAPAVVMVIADLPPTDDRSWWLRHLHEPEITACLARRHAAVHLVARLAAKRACIVALASTTPMTERDLVIAGGLGVPPRVALLAGPAVHARAVQNLSLSMSHTLWRAGALAVTEAACGFDILDLPRWERAMQRSGAALVDRVTSPAERAADTSAGLHTAGLAALRFSVKESVIKAAGGLPRGSGFHDIEVVARVAGDPAPAVRLHGVLGRHADDLGLRTVRTAVLAGDGNALQSTVVLAKDD